jgi:hypothetical protein
LCCLSLLDLRFVITFLVSLSSSYTYDNFCVTEIKYIMYMMFEDYNVPYNKAPHNSSKIKQTNYRNRDETDIPAEHINGRLLSWLGTQTSIKSGGG